jgi:hypothetical protein
MTPGPPVDRVAPGGRPVTLRGEPERGCALGSGRSYLKTFLIFSLACLRLPLA